MRAPPPRTTGGGDSPDYGVDVGDEISDEIGDGVPRAPAGIASAAAATTAVTTVLTLRTRCHFAPTARLTCSHHPAWPTTRPPISRWARATLTWPGLRPVRTTTWSRLAGCQPRASRTLTWSGSSGVSNASWFPRHRRRRFGPRPSRSRATRMSWTSRAGGEPVAKSSLVYNDAGLLTGPGTAMTVTPRVSAAFTVCHDPPFARDSTTTRTSASAARIRLRAGKRHGSGRGPSGGPP